MKFVEGVIAKYTQGGEGGPWGPKIGVKKISPEYRGQKNFQPSARPKGAVG